MKMRVNIILAVLALLAAATILAINSPRHQQTPTLKFEGLRICRFEPGNAGRDKNYAAFRLTNGTAHRIMLWAESLELWDGIKWQTNVLRSTPTNWPHFGASFAPFETGVFYVPPPTNVRWRIRLGCAEHSEGMRGHHDRLSDTWYNWKNRATAVQMETFNGAKYVIASEEVRQ